MYVYIQPQILYYTVSVCASYNSKQKQHRSPLLNHFYSREHYLEVEALLWHAPHSLHNEHTATLYYIIIFAKVFYPIQFTVHD
ncbi:hypothetical protein GDO86_006537 [Hymenochirus boettgeri]|uniref:Uncharacterized protein n=1 Tax=Hymenochirus boettgeri TaxID=247094 RepID=A0A8T2JEF6_9PIPI|nr:hypothetical protein GDO86_006537 [Hymenochirus boettgeri]